MVGVKVRSLGSSAPGMIDQDQRGKSVRVGKVEDPSNHWISFAFCRVDTRVV